MIQTAPQFCQQSVGKRLDQNLNQRHLLQLQRGKIAGSKEMLRVYESMKRRFFCARSSD